MGGGKTETLIEGTSIGCPLHALRPGLVIEPATEVHAFELNRTQDPSWSQTGKGWPFFRGKEDWPLKKIFFYV